MASLRGLSNTELLRCLGSPNLKAGTITAQVVAAIAGVELPTNHWPELIEILLGFVNPADNNTNLKIATLQTIGFICETIKPEILSLRSNEILTAVIHGARKEEPSTEVQLAAIHALFNSLEFVRDNFDREGERNYIMQVVCEATQNPSVTVQVAAFECLVRIMSLYYDKMGFYMERALFGLTVLGMKHPEESVALQAVEFWSTVCDEEVELAIEAAEAQEYGEAPEHESKNFAKTALPEIVPVLLGLLLRQEEDAEEDEWNISMAAATCLTLLAQTVSDAIVPAVLQFIESNIKAQDWRQREAAVMTFGSILEGPDPDVLRNLVTQALPVLVDMMSDENTHVKDTTAWTLGRVCDLVPESIKVEEHLHPLISAFVNGLDDSPRIVSNCCWGLMNLADRLGNFYGEGEEAAQQPSVLTPYFEGVVNALLRLTEKPTLDPSSRSTAYEALASYVSHSERTSLPVVSNVIMTVLSRMEHLLNMQSELLGPDDRINWNELQGNLCGVIIAVVRRLGPEIQPLGDRIMTLMLRLIQGASKLSTVLEDAFLVVGYLSTALEQNFGNYMAAFSPMLYNALKAHEYTQLCTIAVGLIGDISRALGEQSAQYSDAFMNVLLENLQSEVLSRTVKIPILTSFGDIAMAIGPLFDPYLETTMTVLQQAGSVQAGLNDYEMIDYVNQLREGILETYVGIVTAFKNTEKAQRLLPHVSAMLDLIRRSLEDEDKTENAIKLGVGLIGDLADTFPNGQIKEFLLTDWIAAALKAKSRVSPETKKTMRWAREMVKRSTA
ncbi:hypothetical protein M422DRAFT_59555 [Sphaerobolus stellatus SS14]|nr:hypothetical protein M422DRAFT_59555 [Sphaerobolus stellatus SS14]